MPAGTSVCESTDVEIRAQQRPLKLKRLVERGAMVETEPGLFTQPRP
jgi:hypothetical protein